jgi:hypothetical protein
MTGDTPASRIIRAWRTTDRGGLCSHLR